MNNKPEFIKNPKTGRLIRVGSKTHKKLITSGILGEPITSIDENVILEADNPEQAKELQKKINKKTEKNKVITRRGNKVLKANRRPTRTEIIDKVSDMAIDTVIENKDELMNQDLTDEEMDNYIRNLILLKLSGHDTKKQRPKTPPTEPIEPPQKINTRKVRFELDDF